MQRHAIRTLEELDLLLRGSVVTVGVFDGMHLGHQSILDRLLSAARRRGAPSVCVTFSVHPRAVLAGEAPHQILSLEHRLDLIEARGVDHAVVIRFDEAFARIEAERFVEELLVRQLGITELVIGHDTTIGRARRGDAQRLAQLGLRYGFEVVAMGQVLVDGEVVSSTAVRHAIAAGELVRARRLLGRPVSLLGRIVHGDGRGATLGFPTANLEVTSEAFPPLGVYAVTAECSAGTLPGVMNYGMRPTFRQAAERAVFEVHVLDRTDLALYGERMEVSLHAFLRRERRFDGPDDLRRQIAADIEEARAVLAGVGPPAGD